MTSPRINPTQTPSKAHERQLGLQWKGQDVRRLTSPATDNQAQNLSKSTTIYLSSNGHPIAVDFRSSYIYILKPHPSHPKISFLFRRRHTSAVPRRVGPVLPGAKMESPHGGDSHRCGVEVKDIGRDAIEDHEAQDHDCKVLGIFQYFLDPRV